MDERHDEKKRRAAAAARKARKGWEDVERRRQVWWGVGFRAGGGAGVSRGVLNAEFRSNGREGGGAFYAARYTIHIVPFSFP